VVAGVVVTTVPNNASPKEAAAHQHPMMNRNRDDDALAVAHNLRGGISVVAAAKDRR
jgi:hypothetical protein